MLVLLAAGCGGGARTAATGGARPVTPLAPTSAAPSTSPSARPSARPSTPAPSAAAAPASALRTAEDLQRVLLGLDDLDTGYALLPPGGDDLVASSKVPACRDLVRLLDTRTEPGAAATARVSLDGGLDSASVQERLDALPTALAAGDRLISEVVAVRTCPSVSVRVPGAAVAVFRVHQVSFAPGAYGYAARLTGTGGADGAQFIAAGTSTDGVLVHVVTDATATDAEDIVSTALEKVHGGSGGAPA